MEKNKKRKTFYTVFLKRFLDVICATLAIIVLSPVFLVVWIISKFSIGGKAIFCQYRPGKDGKIFKLYKFRSMTNKTDENGDLLPDEQRITKFGKIIRKLSLDELPQLFNIVKGDMSFIGPRPRMVQECVFLDEEHQDRFKVRPGITGWAQVNGRNNITFDKVVEFDKEYVEKISFAFDIKILFKTVGYVFKRKGINKEGTVSNEFHGDYLLRTNLITQEYYASKMREAKELIAKAKEEK